MSKAIAHSPNEAQEPHYLEDHLKSVAQLAQSFLSQTELAGLAYYTGLWHDLGKYTKQWQQALKDAIAHEQATGKRKRLGVPHAMHGALLASRYSAIASLCIAGHHAGMPNLSELKGKLKNKTVRDRSDPDQVLPQAQAELKELLPDGHLDPVPSNRSQLERLRFELKIRMVFSALIDADRLDAAAHAASQPYQAPQHPSMAQLQQRFEGKRSEVIARSKAPFQVNQVRQSIYESCLQAGQQKPGLYKLCAPTGGGKTLALMGFALTQALQHGMRRIIYAAPFTSILEQTAEIYRTMLGSDSVLEHHSNAKEQDYTLDRIRLAAQNWDSPIIVTTTVQLLESLFSNRPSKCRKLHNIVGAVIVFDEVQTLPAHLMTPILSMLQALIDLAGCSVLLCTATQPAYSYIKGVDCNPVDVISPTAIASHFSQLQRVRYQSASKPWSWREVADDIQTRNLQQVLVVVNSTTDAREGFEVLKQSFQEDCYHLSARMYARHRQRVLKRIKEVLKQKKRCCLVSTQLIEAGVDLDFTDGYRVFAPLDSIVQTAGRINRNGTLERLGTLVVFNLMESNAYPSKDYGLCARQAARIMDNGADLNTPEAFEQYFSWRYSTTNTDPKGIQELRAAMAFESVAEKFKLIDESSESVFVAQDSEPEACQLLQELESKSYLERSDFRRSQPYLVNLSVSFLDKHQSEWHESSCGLRIWDGAYDKNYGIAPS